MCVCVCVCVYACVRECARARACVSACVLKVMRKPDVELSTAVYLLIQLVGVFCPLNSVHFAHPVAPYCALSGSR